MISDLEGSCNCGAIHVVIEGGLDGHKGTACHCRNCQATSGSLFSYNYEVPTSTIKITKGTPKVYEQHGTASGMPIDRMFCGDCGSPIMTRPSSRPDVVYVKSGLFDERMPPTEDIFFKDAAGWQTPIGPKDSAVA